MVTLNKLRVVFVTASRFVMLHHSSRTVCSSLEIHTQKTLSLELLREPWGFGCQAAAKIEDIPAGHDLKPYRNCVINTGINNINSENRRSSQVLSEMLNLKCKDILNTHPKSKVFINLMLSTKSKYLNNRVDELNNLILDMAFGSKRLFIIDNSLLADGNGLLSPENGRFDKVNKKHYTKHLLHLGRKGLKVFCTTIKKSIIRKGNNQNSSRLKGGRGNYATALERGTQGLRGTRVSPSTRGSTVARGSPGAGGMPGARGSAGTRGSPIVGENRFSPLADLHE